MKKETPPSARKIDEQSIADNFLPKAWIFVGLATAILMFFYTTTFWKFGAFLSNDQEIWGQFGDFLGGILNPLISFLTLGVATKVWQLQQRELTKTQQALKQQGDTSELQRFENTLFKLIEHSNNSIKNFSVQKKRAVVIAPRLVGLEAIQYLAEQFKVSHYLEGQLTKEKVDSVIEEFNAYSFWESYPVVKFAYIFALKNCPIESRGLEYATMASTLIGNDAIFLCRCWAIACKDESFLMLLPEDQPKSS